jgi:hypothetical protein
MKTIKTCYVIFLIFAGTFLFVSCEKNDKKVTDQDIEMADDEAIVTLMFDQAFNETDLALEQLEYNWKHPAGLKSILDTCPVIYVDHNDSTYWPKTVTIYFGSASCEGPFGNIKKGMIIITITDRYLKQGSVRTVSFEDFYINDFKVEGTKTVTNEGRNDDGFMYFSVELAGGKVTTPAGKLITHEFSRTRIWIEGEQTPRWRLDNKYLIEGEASGINRFGISYTRTITTPLLVAASCRWIMSGIIEIQPEDHSLILLNFGDGECDNVGTITVNGETKEIKLRGR